MITAYQLMKVIIFTTTTEPLEPAAPLFVTFNDSLRPRDGDVVEATPTLSVPRTRLILSVLCRPATP